MKYFLMRLITLDLIFIIISLVPKFMEITKIKMIEQANEHTIHKMNTRCDLGKRYGRKPK